MTQLLSIKIPLNKGMHTIIDKENYEKISFNKNKKWFAILKGGNNYYVTTRIKWGKKYKTILMHRLILDLIDRPIVHVDHINRNSLDNRKSNLRIATQTQNNSNRKKSKNMTSIYMGVYKETRKNRKPWVAQISIKNVSTYIGSFNNEIEAARAYNKKAFEIHGEFAHLNEI